MKLILASLLAGSAAGFAPAQQGASSSALKEFAGGMVGGEKYRSINVHRLIFFDIQLYSFSHATHSNPTNQTSIWT